MDRILGTTSGFNIGIINSLLYTSLGLTEILTMKCWRNGERPGPINNQLVRLLNLISALFVVWFIYLRCTQLAQFTAYTK